MWVERFTFFISSSSTGKDFFLCPSDTKLKIEPLHSAWNTDSKFGFEPFPQ